MSNIQINQLCFARWSDGYYYPAVTGEILLDYAKVAYLDGSSGLVPIECVISLQEAFRTMGIQGNFKYGGIFFKGVISNPQQMVMSYDDGDIEQVELRQLRCFKSGM